MNAQRGPALRLAALASVAVTAALLAIERRGGEAAPDKTDAYPYHIFVPMVGSDGALSVFNPRLAAAIALQQAESRWYASGIEDYRLVGRYGSFGQEERVTVLVHGGVVVASSVECIRPQPPGDCRQIAAENYTVPGLFALIWAWIPALPQAEEPGRPVLTVEYDEALGFPLAFSIRTAGVPDSGWGIAVESLEILPPK